MASVFGHSVLAYTIAKVSAKKQNTYLVLLAVLSSILPDIDVLAFNFGVPYQSPWGHRGFTHSLLFAGIWALLIAFFFGKHRKKLFFVVVFLATVSHAVLDALTTGGKGVGFLIPFNNERFFFPLKIIKVSPIGITRFFSKWGVEVLLSEIKFIVIPCVLILITLKVLKRHNNKV